MVSERLEESYDFPSTGRYEQWLKMYHPDVLKGVYVKIVYFYLQLLIVLRHLSMRKLS